MLKKPQVADSALFYFPLVYTNGTKGEMSAGLGTFLISSQKFEKDAQLNTVSDFIKIKCITLNGKTLTVNYKQPQLKPNEVFDIINRRYTRRTLDAEE